MFLFHSSSFFLSLSNDINFISSKISSIINTFICCLYMCVYISWVLFFTCLYIYISTQNLLSLSLSLTIFIYIYIWNKNNNHFETTMYICQRLQQQPQPQPKNELRKKLKIFLSNHVNSNLTCLTNNILISFAFCWLINKIALFLFWNYIRIIWLRNNPPLFFE